MNYAMLLLIAGLAVVGLSQAIPKIKASNRKMFTWIGIVGLGISVFAMASPGTIPFLEGEFDFGGTTGDALAVTSSGQVISTGIAGCNKEDTTVTLAATDSFTSSATGGTHAYRINGAPRKEVSDGGTFTASPGNVIEILWFNASATGPYYSEVTTVTVPCDGTKTFTNELVSNATITIQVFNEDGDAIVAGGTVVETLTNGDVVTLDAKLKASFESGFKYGGVLVCDANGSVIDDCILDFGGSKTSVPEIHTVIYPTDSKVTAYTIPAILGTTPLSGQITIDVDDTNDPTGKDGNMTLWWYPANLFINEETGASFDGPSVEDEDGVRTMNDKLPFNISIQ